jgi:SulP family sulfate permease
VLGKDKAVHLTQDKSTRAAKDLISGGVVSLVAIAFYISAATLLFQGPLLPHLSTAIGASLFGGALLAVFQAAKGSLELASVGPEPVTVPVLAGLTALVAAQCSAQSVFPTAVAALSVAALCIGIVWFVLGRMKAGDVIRYIPYPVIGGFLASVGWLMLAGGVAVVLGRSFALRDIPNLVAGPQGLQLLSGAAIALTLWWATLRIKHVLVLPGLIVFFIVLVHAGLGLTGISVDAARAQGWFNMEFAQAILVSPLAPQTFVLVDWNVIAGQAGTIMTAVILSVVALLLSDSSLEVAFEERADFNRDLRLLGGANMLLGLAGGLTGGVSISRSILNQQAGAATRRSGLVKAALCILAIFWGGPIISLVPKPLLGGILMYIGIGMLKFWLIDGRTKLARNDYFAVLAILALTIGVGYLPAVVVGIVICCFDFAVSSAKTGPIRRTFSRNEWPGKVERSAIETAALQKDGERMRIVELQGALFFGSIRTLAGDLESLLGAGEKPDRLVIDFKRVASMDSSAAQAMSRVLKVAKRFDVPVSFTSADERVLALLRANGCIYPGGPDIVEDIDQAIVHWDDEKLGTQMASSAPLEEWLAAELGGSGAVQELLSWLEPKHLEAGDVLFHENENADSLYLVQKGRLNLTVQHKGKSFKIRSIQAGGTVGEMGMYRLRDRSATVTAGEPSSVLRMSDQTMRRIEAKSPELALGLHKLFVRLLASRLEHSNAQLKAMAS